MTCAHRDLHFLKANAGVFCRFCGATWKRSRRNLGSHLMLTEEIQTDGVLYSEPPAKPEPLPSEKCAICGLARTYHVGEIETLHSRLHTFQEKGEADAK